MMSSMQKQIVILGAGFAGLRVALELAEKLHSKVAPFWRINCLAEARAKRVLSNCCPAKRDSTKLRLGLVYEIILIDERNTHIYTPDLYEIATAFNEKITYECLTQLKDTVAIPYSKILRRPSVTFLKDKITQINLEKREVWLKNKGRLFADYLVVTLGSAVNYRDIPGLREFSLTLKTVTDALALNCHLDSHFYTLLEKKTQKKITVVIGGGGATGVELACEIPGHMNKLCKKYNYPRELIEIIVIEGSSELTGQGEKVTERILRRFKKLGIQTQLNTYIKKVESDIVYVESKNGSKIIPMDILIWTGGVMPNPLIKNALPVNEFLEYESSPGVFAAGDNAEFIDSRTLMRAPMLAQIAFQQGKIIAHNIDAQIQNKPKKKYRLKFKGIIIPLGGRYALYKKGEIIIEGFFMWLLRRLIDLFYGISILPLPYAIKKWIRDTRVFVKND